MSEMETALQTLQTAIENQRARDPRAINWANVLKMIQTILAMVANGINTPATTA